MWIPAKVIDLIEVSKDSVDSMRAELAAVRAERDLLKAQVLQLQITSDWMRMKVNQLELEKAGLMQQALGIRIPVPEIVQQPKPDHLSEFSFEDIGDDEAKKHGLPHYGLPKVDVKN